MEGFTAVMSIEPSILEVASTSLIRETSLLIRISTSRVELRWRLVVVLAIGLHWHSVHDRVRRTCYVVNSRFSTLHCQGVQLNCWRDVAGIVFTAHLDAFQLTIRFQRRMLVSSLQDCIFSCRVLSFLDT